MNDQNNILEISRAKVSSNLLDINYTHCNRNFTHVSIMPPEYRPSPLKNANNNSNFTSKEEEIAVSFDPNNDRTHLVDMWRKFTLHQVNHAKEYFKLNLKLKGIVENFNIRLLELLIFDNVIIFSKCLKVTHKKNKYSILSNDIRESDFLIY